uniref:Wings apart-like protein homolog n=1 Tax=Astyanax mexicanus TaxID=7994 RepID=A0A8B9RGJ2_ASTMX
MTSRFSKTYTRKGGEANSKFEEVFANKKATLSTKWGETTYKAQLGTKRPTYKPEVSDMVKRPRFEEDDDSEDPFGFDSDEESNTVTSRGTPQSDMGSGAAGSVNEKPKAHGAALVSGGTLALGSNVSRIYCVLNKMFNCDKKKSYCLLQIYLLYLLFVYFPFPAVKPQQTSSNASAGTAWYKSSSAADKPISQPYIIKTSTRDSADNWDSHRDDSLSGPGQGASTQISNTSDSLKTTEPSPAEAELPPQPVEFDQLPLHKPASNRVYRRPNRSRDQLETSGFVETSTGAGAGAGTSATAQVKGASGGVASGSEVKPAPGRGRVRDYTVLHPSCVSVCNVTIQDSMDRSMDELVNTTPTDLGEAGTFRKKTDAQAAKPTRFRPTQTKTKKETKLEFFGFEENEGQDADGEPGASGSTSYKIKYFGFDDLSESDSEEEEDTAARDRKKAKKAASEALMGGVDSPQTSDSQESQTNYDLTVCVCVFQASGKAVYNARHWNQPEVEDVSPPPVVPSGSKDANSKKDDGVFKAPPPPPKVIKTVTVPTEPYQDIITSLKCNKEHKELYTVVQHVKHFNDVVEFGENQEFTDDFEYLETGLKSTQPLNTRCLSIISLATRCAMPSFRMHLRARGKVAQVFKMLSDAPQHPNLALCTASLMYILSRDRLNMDLDRACLELMIRLLELEQDNTVEDQLTAKEISKVKEKIRKLCETVHNKHLDLENINTGHLAMETLLSLTSKRAGDWFKEELRLLGGLDHIVDKVKECVESLDKEEDKENLVASLWGAERCLRVLESVTVHNPENQAYLIAYKESQLIVSSARGLRYCEEMIQRYSREVNSSLSSSGTALPHCSHSNVGKAVEDCMRAVIGVLLNLTHDNEWGSTKTGEQDQLIITALNCVLKVPRFIPPEQRFDIRVLGLGLLINLVEYSSRNRYGLVEMEVDTSCLIEGEEENKPSIQGSANALTALVQLFLERERAAVLAEAQTDDLISEAPKSQADQSGEWQETSGEIQWVATENNETNDTKEKEKEEEDEELDLNKALQHAGKHMEDSIVASYTALLLGCLCQDSPLNVKSVRESLPKGDFSIMTEMLKKFLNFMNLTCSVGTTGQKSISRVIDYLEHC